MAILQTLQHKKSTIFYPGSQVSPGQVNFKSWTVSDSDYIPSFYESPDVLDDPTSDPPADLFVHHQIVPLL